MKKQRFKYRTLAVILAVFSSVAAMGQQKTDETDWMKDFTSRITLNGYAQGGWSFQDANGHTYDFAFGMNWSGVIDDERAKKYK